MAGAAPLDTLPRAIQTVQPTPFRVAEDERLPSGQPKETPDRPGVLRELQDYRLNGSFTAGHADTALAASRNKLRLVHRPKNKLAKAKLAPRVHRLYRPPLDLENFVPLGAVQEEGDSLTLSQVPVAAGSCRDPIDLQNSGTSQYIDLEPHPLTTAALDCPIRQQIGRHLAGQFEWLLSFPTPNSKANRHDFQDVETDGPTGNMVFGCNLLSRKGRCASHANDDIRAGADTYALIATPLNGDAYSFRRAEEAEALGDRIMMTLPQSSLQPGTSLNSQGPELGEPALSPSLTVTSERTSHDGLSPVGSFSIPRIEDSLEELDRLEEELEAIHAVAQPKHVLSRNSQDPNPVSNHSNNAAKPNAKRVSIVGPFATVRVKPAEKTRVAARPSSSLALRSKPAEGPVRSPEQKTGGSLVRSKSTVLRSATTKPTVKSSKPLTVPSFELPGEAVARRLKEQREARQAQQIDAQKVQATPTRSRSSRSLAKPTFELPGEAISRKKREEREARLKVQEEEERQKREFKARPFRHTVGPGTFPKETLASLARQGKLPQPDDAGKGAETMRSKRMSLAEAVNERATVSGRSPQARGRNSMFLPQTDNFSRGTSASTGSTGGQRSTVSAEDSAQQKMRGKAIFARDNSWAQDRERERLEREEAARRAREEAAERSRAASREWAEKRRRREQTVRPGIRTTVQQNMGR